MGPGSDVKYSKQEYSPGQMGQMQMSPMQAQQQGGQVLAQSPNPMDGRFDRFDQMQLATTARSSCSGGLALAQTANSSQPRVQPLGALANALSGSSPFFTFPLFALFAYSISQFKGLMLFLWTIFYTRDYVGLISD